MTKLKDRLELFFAEIWGNENEAAIAKWMLSDVEAEGISPKRVVGTAEFAQFHRVILAQFTDLRLAIDHSIEDEEWLALFGHIHMTHRSTGKQIAMPSQMMIKFVDGRLAIGRNALDFIALFEGSGALPEGTLAHLLGGEQLKMA